MKRVSAATHLDFRADKELTYIERRGRVGFLAERVTSRERLPISRSPSAALSNDRLQLPCNILSKLARPLRREMDEVVKVIRVMRELVLRVNYRYTLGFAEVSSGVMETFEQPQVVGD